MFESLWKTAAPPVPKTPSPPPAIKDPTKMCIIGKIRRHKIGDEIITVDLEIENTQTTKHIAAFAMTITESKYWHLKRVLFSALAPLTTIKQTVELKCKIGVSRLDADRYITARFYHVNSEEGAGRQVRFEWTFNSMVTPFRQYAAEMPPGVPMTIVIVGMSGAGKTALVRSVLTAGSDDRDIQRPGAVASFGEHVTHKLEYYSMEDLPNVQVADIFGHADDQYVAGEKPRDKKKTWGEIEMEHLLNGTLPPGWSMRDKIDNEGRPTLLDAQARLRHIPTSFIYVLDAREVDNEETLEKEARRYKTMTRKAGYEGIIALTHVDHLITETRECPMGTHPEIEEMKAKVVHGMGAPPHTVYVAVPYTFERVRHYDIDRCNGVVLEASMKQSLQFAKFHLPNRLRDFTDVEE